MQRTTNETRAHDNILWQVASLIGRSDYFNWQHDSHEGHVINIEHCRTGADMQIYRLKPTGNNDPQFKYHKVNPYYTDTKTGSKENRPAYICPIEIKVTQGDLEKVAYEGLKEANGARATKDDTWQYSICIAVRFNDFRDLKSIDKAVCFMTKDYMKTVHVQWAVHNLVEFNDLCRSTIPQLVAGYVGHTYKQTESQPEYIDYDEPPWQLFAKNNLLKMVINGTLKAKQAEMLDAWVDGDHITHQYPSERKSTEKWAEAGGVGKTTFRNSIVLLGSMGIIEYQKSKGNRNTDLYSIKVGRALVQHD